MKKSQNGLSLAEVCIVMMLLLLILGLVGGLVRNYSTTIAFATAKEKSIRAAQVGLRAIGAEARSAGRFQSPPNLGNWHSLLEFEKLDPSQAQSRFPDPVPDPPPLSWDGLGAIRMLTIRYNQDSVTNRLTRQVSAGGQSDSRPISDEIEGFSCRLDANGTLSYRVTIQEKKRLRVLAGKTHLPLGVQP